MDQRYLADKYEFVKPYHGKWWLRGVRPFFYRLIKKLYRVSPVVTLHAERIKQSADAGYGVIIAANHCRYSDPFVLADISKRTGVYFFFCASWHLFHSKPWQGWMIRRTGAMSIYREGTDRDCLRECQRIVEEAERPLVLFPEGTFYRQNDRLGPMQDGVSFIARLAQKKNARPVVIHPVGIKYWFVEDPTAAIEKRLCQLEQRCHIHPKRGKDFVRRLEWIAGSLLAVKEMEIHGTIGTGSLDERQKNLADHVCQQLEAKYFSRTKGGALMDRIRTVRNHVVKQFTTSPRESPEWYDLLYEIEDLAFAQQLFSHSWSYIHEWPSLERVSETLMRLEEDLYDEETPTGDMGVIMDVGEPIFVQEYVDQKSSRDEGDPLTRLLQTRIQSQLDQLVSAGPPADWSSPTQPRQAPITMATISHS
ncbi:1-acyl-sn-glycerol-3-phosphate acyltransferase [bacterium]|nr:1-acyl-sn-glycerol-3-phosphate acyltransferase [bacterium]